MFSDGTVPLTIKIVTIMCSKHFFVFFLLTRYNKIQHRMTSSLSLPMIMLFNDYFITNFTDYYIKS